MSTTPREHESTRKWEGASTSQHQPAPTLLFSQNKRETKMVLRNVDNSFYPKPYMSKHFRLTSREFGKPKQPKNYKKALDRAKRAVLSLSFPLTHF